MRLTLILSTFFFCAGYSIGQNTYSKVFYRSSGGGIFGSSFVQQTDGKLLLAGQTQTNMGQFTQLDVNANHLQTVVLDVNSQVGQSVGLRNVLIVNDSVYLLSGQCYNASSGNYEMLAVSIDQNGDTLFASTYANPGDADSYTVEASVRTPNNHTLILGSSFPMIYSTMYLLELDDNGQVIWSKKYDQLESIRPMDLQVAEDSTYYICGQIDSDGFWMHLDSDGNVLWTKRSTDIVPDRMLLSEHGIFLSGTKYQDLRIVRCNYDGELLVTNQFSGTLVYENQTKVLPYTDSTYIVLSGHPYESTLSVIDTALNLLQLHRLYINFTDAFRDNDNQFIVLGNGPLWGLRGGGAILDDHIGVMKLDTALNTHLMNCMYTSQEIGNPFPLTTTTFSFTTANGNLTPFHPEITLSTITPASYNGCVSQFGGMEEVDLIAVTIYPTVSDGIVHVHSDEQQPVKVFVHDAAGNLLQILKLNSGQSTLDLTAYEAGVYFFQLETENGHFATRRIILTGN